MDTWLYVFDILSPKKNKKGLRKYTKKDIDILKKIYILLKKEGFTIEGAKKALNKKTINNENEIQSKLRGPIVGSKYPSVKSKTLKL